MMKTLENGLSTITFEVEGKKGLQQVMVQHLLFQKPARCILDYLTNTRYGKSIAVVDIDLTTFQAAVITHQKDFIVGNLDTKARMYTNMVDLFTSCRSYLAFGNKCRLPKM